MDDNLENQTPQSTNQEPKPIESPASTPFSVPVTTSASTEPVIQSTAPVVSSAPAASVIGDTPEVNDNPTPPTGPVVVTHKNPKGKKLFTALLVLIVLVAAGAAVWWFTSKNDKPQVTTTVKDVAVIHYGSVEGPIGKSSIFPAAPGVALPNTIDQQIYEGLVGLKNQKVEPLLASSWKNPDDSTWIFTLRPNVTFQNGKKVDAAAVKASLDALQNNEDWSQYVSTIKSVDVVDSSHVKIVTTQPDALLLNRLTTAFIYDTTSSDPTAPAGTGAYVVDQSKTNDETVVTLKPYDKYYQGRPKTRSLVFTIYKSDAALIAAAKAHKVNVLDEVRDATFTKALAPSGFAMIDSESPGSYSLQFNTVKKDSPVTKLQVRQAVANAMDRAALIKKLTTPYEATRYMVPKSVLGYDSTAELPAFDITKAKSLQTEAGYANGTPLTVAYIKDIQQEIPIVIDQLKAAGFKVTVKEAATPDDMIAIIKSGDFDVVGFSTSSDYSDAGDYFTQVLSSTSSNFQLYNIPEVDSMLTKSNEEFDTTSRIKELQQINRYAADNALIVPLRNAAYTTYYDNNLTYTFDFNAVSPATYYWNVGQKVSVTTN